MSQKSCHASPRREFFLFNVPGGAFWALAVGQPFSSPGAKKGRDGNKFQCQACFLHIYWGRQLSLAPCYCSTLFSWKRTAPLSSDQAHFLLRPRSLFEVTVARSPLFCWWIYLPGWVVLLSWWLRTFFPFPTEFCRGIWQYVSTMFPCGVHSVLVCF